MKPVSVRHKAIIFDLGRVLLDFDWQMALDQLAARSHPGREAIYERIARHESHLAFELGKLSSADFFQLWQRELGFDGSVVELQTIWNQIFQPIDKNLQLMQELRASHRLAILSNTNPAHLAYLHAGYPELQAVDYACYSCEVGLRKPDAAIYRLVCQRLQMAPGDCYFIDDLEDNVAGARGQGLQAIHYTGQDLRAELQLLDAI